MKRLIAIAVGICIAGSVLAQSSFTIVRPADGSKVREKVRVMIPKNSLDAGSYVGIFLNGKFLEAVVPPVQGNYRVYTLDTKGRNIPDGEAKLELVKYEGGDTPRIADRSSVTVTVGNQMNIPIPAGGVHLRYGFTIDQQMIYDVTETVTVWTLSGIGMDNNSHAAQFPQSEESFRTLYAVDNTYANGDALLRMQDLPDKGKDYAVFSLIGSTGPQQVYDYQMEPTYMRVDKTARPLFGAVPEYFGFTNSPGQETSYVGVYGTMPLPVFPEKAVAPGQNWQTPYLMPVITIQGDPHLTDKVTEAFPARSEFVDAEWEMGHPCAKIRNSIAAGTRSFAGQQLEKAGKPFADDRVALEETVYFALDIHKILKLIRTTTIDHKVEVQTAPSGGNGGPVGAGGAPVGQMGVGAGAPVGGGGPKGAGGGGAGIGFQKPGMARPGQPGGGPVGAGQGRGPRTGGGGGAGSGGSKTMYIRQLFQQTYILEQ